jgi:hypothetical protein
MVLDINSSSPNKSPIYAHVNLLRAVNWKHGTFNTVLGQSLFVQDNTQKGFVDVDLAVVLDET